MIRLSGRRGPRAGRPRHRPALAAGLALMALTGLWACGDDEVSSTIDIRVYPARLDDRPGEPPPPGWQRVAFAGSARTPAATYLVAPDSLLTGWSLVAFRAAVEPDGSRAVTCRINAAGQKRLADFAADETHLKMPLAVRVDARWADFSPLLRPPGDRLTLYGLTADEAVRLERWLAVR